MLPAPASLEELLAESSWLRGLAASLVRDGATAEDVVQETWLRALHHPPQGGGSPRPWLARVARNLASNLRRTEARRERRESELRWTAPELDPSVLVEEVEAQRVLAEAVLRLEEPLRTALVLRYVRGFDSKEIGRQQGAPAGTVRWRLKRALELLRADLDRRFGERTQWCSALGAFLRRGPGGIPTAGAPLASSSVITAAAAVATASLLALSGAWWVASWDHPRGAGMARTDESQTARVLDEDHSELATPEEVDEPAKPEPSARVRSLPDAGARARAGPRRRSPIHGQLSIAGSGDALDEALTVRLRMGDLSVKETVVSAADGSFTSKKAFPRGFVLAEVLRPAGDPAVDFESYFDPSSDEAWTVSVPWPNLVRGRLVDRRGEPLTEAEIRLFQGSAEKEQDGNRSGDSGTFSYSGLGLGTCKVTVRHGFQHHQFYVDVARGPNELGDVVVPFNERVGPISGRLRSAVGRPHGWLVLSDLASGASYERMETDSDSRFEFEEVPLGNYRLTLYPCDGLRYAARTQLVSPPSTDIEFFASGEVEPLLFRATDAQSGREIEARPWVLQSGRWCGPEVSCEPADVERWVLVAKDHRPASGRTPETAQVDARLEPGWGCALFFTEGTGGDYPERRGPIAGVEVWADGLLLARSDQDGLALVSLPRKPGQDGDKEIRLECGLNGWVLEYGDAVVGNRLVLDSGVVYAFTVLRRE